MYISKNYISQVKKFYLEFNFHLGFCATIAVSVFTTFANQPGWMPGQENNFFGWTFGVAIASCFLLISSGAFYLLETKIQVSIMKSLRQSQIHIDNDIDEI